MQAQVQVLDVVDPGGRPAAAARGAATSCTALANAAGPRPGRVRRRRARHRRPAGARRRGRRTSCVHLVVDVRDAMGANAVNTMAEAIAPRVAEIAGGRACCASSPTRPTAADPRPRRLRRRACWAAPQVVDDMIDAAEFAVADPYRAATHNKGIMNGITAVVLATGNDTRAVEAGAHSHAVGPDGRYTALSTLREGRRRQPRRHPRAADAGRPRRRRHEGPSGRPGRRRGCCGVRPPPSWPRVIVAVGLAQNAAALRALATEGIQRGHMSLHARNVAVSAGADPHEIDVVVARLIADGAVRSEHAERVLAELRA